MWMWVIYVRFGNLLRWIHTMHRSVLWLFMRPCIMHALVIWLPAEQLLYDAKEAEK